MKKLYVELAISKSASHDEYIMGKLNLQANVVAEHFSRLLPDVDIKLVKKIRINLIGDEEKEVILPPLDISPVCQINKLYDINGLMILSEKEKKIEMLEIIYKNIMKASEELKWNKIPFNVAYQKVKEENHENRFIVGEKILSKDKNYGACVEIFMDITGSTVSVLFFDKRDSFIKKIDLFTALPHFMFIDNLIDKRKFKWINSNEFCISNKLGEIHFKASFESNEGNLFLTPKKNSLEFLLDEVKIASMSLTIDEKLDLLHKRLNLR